MTRLSLSDKISQIRNNRQSKTSYELLREALTLLKEEYPEVQSLSYRWGDGKITDFSRSALGLYSINNLAVSYASASDFRSFLVEINIRQHRYEGITKVAKNRDFIDLVFAIHKKQEEIILRLPGNPNSLPGKVVEAKQELDTKLKEIKAKYPFIKTITYAYSPSGILKIQQINGLVVTKLQSEKDFNKNEIKSIFVELDMKQVPFLSLLTDLRSQETYTMVYLACFYEGRSVTMELKL